MNKDFKTNEAKVYGYVRLSCGEDKEQSSLTNQKQILLDYAETQGYNIINIFEDDNVSGMTFDREGLKQLQEVIDKEKVDIILIKIYGIWHNQLEKTDLKIMLEHLQIKKCIDMQDY